MLCPRSSRAVDELQVALAQRVAGFAERLRKAGLPADQHGVLLFTQSLAHLEARSPRSIYWAGRLCFVKRMDQLETYEREFIAFMNESSDSGAGPSPAEPEAHESSAETGTHTTADSSRAAPDETTVEAAFASSLEVLRAKSFEQISPDENELLKKLIQQIRTLPPTRTTRRMRPASRGRALDLRRMLTESMRTEGEPVRRRWQQSVKEPRRIVFLLDISGSMKPYSRSLLQFAYALRRRHRLTEVFCFGTSLSRLTRHLDTPDVDAALAAAGRLIPDWEGGTRISDSISQFISEWGRRGMARGAVVVLCSDGLERGDPVELGRQMDRLSRLAHRVVWLNPLKGSPTYEPLARGMDAALPYIDTFMPGHNLTSLEELADVLSGIGARR